MFRGNASFAGVDRSVVMELVLEPLKRRPLGSRRVFSPSGLRRFTVMHVMPRRTQFRQDGCWVSHLTLCDRHQSQAVACRRKLGEDAIGIRSQGYEKKCMRRTQVEEFRMDWETLSVVDPILTTSGLTHTHDVIRARRVPDVVWPDTCRQYKHPVNEVLSLILELGSGSRD